MNRQVILPNPSLRDGGAHSRPAIRVEFPREGETISRPSYTLRLGAIPETARVEVSIDDGEWRKCRAASGAWWYDWSGYAQGEHVVVARTRIGEHFCLLSGRRRFRVK